MAGGSYKETYTLIGEAGPFPVEAIIEYKSLGQKRTANISISEFTTSNGILIPTLKTEVSVIGNDFSGVKNEILIVAKNHFNDNGILSPSFILKSSTEAQADPKPTPQQVNEKTEQETRKKEEAQVVTDAKQNDAQPIKNSTPPPLKPTGGEKLAILINKKSSQIKNILIPILIALLFRLGFKIAADLSAKAIKKLKDKLPNQCPTEEELKKIINIRNQVVNRLNNVIKVLNAFTKIITGLNKIVILIGVGILILQGIQTAILIISKLLPVSPGFVPSLAFDIQKIIQKISPIYSKVLGIIAAINLAIVGLNQTLLKLLALVGVLDAYIQKCAAEAELTPIDPDLLLLEKINEEIEKVTNEITYNGFILEIEEIPFSPTVNRRRAVAKNKDGIVLLSTPPSFTTLNEVLLEEIKLVIDSNNLKAD